MGAEPSDLENLVVQWSQLEQQHSRLQSRWQERQQLLQLQLQLLTEEEAALAAFLDNKGEEQSSTNEKRQALVKQQTLMEEAQATLGQALDQVTNQLQSLHYQLPPVLAEPWQEEFRELRANDGTNSQRLEIILRLLRQLDDFNNRIALHKDIIATDSGEIEVEQFYLGTGRGWFVSADGRYYGFGRAGSDGWQWTALHGSDNAQTKATVDADQLLQILTVVKKQTAPRMLRLPISLDSHTPNSVAMDVGQ